MIPDTAIRENGKVAMKLLRKQRILVRCSNGEYVFSMRANIALAWVDEQDVPCCMNVKRNCCGPGRKKSLITFANESDVRRWTNGGGR